jgi:prepilin peptidase CpaA
MAGSGRPLPAIVLIGRGRDILDISTLVILQKVVAYMSMALLAVAGYSDIKTFRIPNLLVGAIAVVGVIRLILLHDPLAAIYAIGAAVLVFTIGLVLFARRIVGGGDVKLLTATILLIRYRDLFDFFTAMSVIGALLSVAVVLVHNHLPIVAGPRLRVRLPKTRLPVPYGVAIAIAGVVTLLFQPLLFRYGW